MHKAILHIAVPGIVSNITVPLLALADTAIAGHLGAASYIGAIALGGMIFNMTYWLFGFLRMGTGGLTAQAYGAGDQTEAERLLGRSLLVAACFSLLLIVCQQPLLQLVFHFVSATPAVEQQARLYYRILVWGAPAVLGLYSFTGWFLGMQNARLPMYIAIVQNLVNILVSLTLVWGFGWKVEGVACGTLVAQYAGLFCALFLWHSRLPFRSSAVHPWRGLLRSGGLGQFFRVNRDIFFRTLCLIAVTTYFTSAGSAQGEQMLAANTLLMQFFILFSYIMDGFAYAGEALGGNYYGAHDVRRFSLLHRSLLGWGVALSLLFTLFYATAGSQLLGWLTDEPSVVRQASVYLPYAVAIPLISFAAFLYDGLFIGTTSTRFMLLTMFVASSLFFVLVTVLPAGNAALWTAFLGYLGSRSVVQAFLYPKVLRSAGGPSQ